MKKKPQDYLFHKFINELIDRKARVRVDGITYEEGHNINIKDLVADLLEITKDDVYKITRNSKLRKKNSRKHSVSNDQETVINHLDFYLENEDLQPHPNLNFTPADFFISGNGITTAIYPHAPQAINKKVYQLIQTTDLSTIAKTNRSKSIKQGPFHPLNEKINKVILSSDDSFRSAINDNLQTLADKYRDVFFNNLEAVKEYASLTKEEQREINQPIQSFIPGYSSIQKSPFIESFKEDLDVQRDQPLSVSFDDPKNWFDSDRYYRLKTLIPELLNKNIQDWPKWVVEHVILTEIEYETIYDHFLELAYKEVKNNVKYTLYMSSDGAKIDMQQDFDDIHELGRKLNQFKFPGKIGRLVDVQRGTILKGPFSKFPEGLVARNKTSTFEIKFDLLEALIGYFHKRICDGIGFPLPKEQKRINKYGELANKLIEDTSENE